MNDMEELTNENIIREVKKYISEGRSTEEILNHVRNTHNEDSVVNSIMDYLAKYRKKIHKVANVFLDAFEKKFKNEFYSMSLSKFMKKGLKYKLKYNLTDEEFDEVKRLFEQRMYNNQVNIKGVNVVYPNTNLSRALGFPIVENRDSIKLTSNDDYTHLQEILKLFHMYRSKHSYVIIQTMIYQDLADEAMNGLYDPKRSDLNVYVHPVIAALFLPKIPSLEERMLYANIAGIINTKYNKERIVTKPDYELFYSLIVDPTDVVCDAISPIKDLRDRSEVQIQLWDNVYCLRSGKYYDPVAVNFMQYIDKCRISNVDNPDMVVLSDEGVILRRLFSIFAFRPLVVQTNPVSTFIVANPLRLPEPMYSLKTLSYITYKLPQVAVEGVDYHLEDSNNLIHFNVENGNLVPKLIRIIDCGRGPIVFYVPRRYVALPLSFVSPQFATPLSMNQLQPSDRHYNQINNISLNFNFDFDVKSNYMKDTKFYLRSVVVYHRWNDTKIILGHDAYLFKYPRDGNQQIIGSIPEIFIYRPSTANMQDYYAIAKSSSDYDAYIKDIQTSGTIFVYANN